MIIRQDKTFNSMANRYLSELFSQHHLTQRQGERYPDKVSQIRKAVVGWVKYGGHLEYTASLVTTFLLALGIGYIQIYVYIHVRFDNFI